MPAKQANRIFVIMIEGGVAHLSGGFTSLSATSTITAAKKKTHPLGGVPKTCRPMAGFVGQVACQPDTLRVLFASRYIVE